MHQEFVWPQHHITRHTTQEGAWGPKWLLCNAFLLPFPCMYKKWELGRLVTLSSDLL